MEKLYSIPELMVIIYKNLTFGDQLRLARVNSILRSIYVSFIFPVKYTKLKITRLEGTEKLLVFNDKHENAMLLTDIEVKNFLLFGAEKLEEMHVSTEVRKDTYIWQLLHFVCVEACGNLQSLTCVHYANITLSEKHLLLIAENCPKLSEVRLIHCTNEDNGEYLMVGRGLSISTLARMKKLKSLEVKVRDGPPIGMSVFCELITNVPLECLMLNVSLVQDRQDYLNSKRFNYDRLKELEIDFDSKSLKFLERTEILKNLVKLHLIMDDVTDSDLQTIAKACQHLEYLAFGHNTTFTDITRFAIPPNLKELSICCSESLKSKHLKTILTKYKIEKFSYRSDEDTFPLKDFKMSANIKVLNLKDINTIQCPSFYANNNTLKELHWYDSGRNLLRATQNRECLKTCRNLENLIVYIGFIPLDVIFELKHLQILHIRWEHEEFTWSYIIGLFKHSSLKKLDIQYVSYDCFDDATNTPAKGFPSTITMLYIGFKYLEKALNFWLDMLKQNPTMLIRCDIYDLSFLTTLIQHENFPKDLREIQVWGFNLNCKDLRENFCATIEPLTRHWMNCALVLSRKQT